MRKVESRLCRLEAEIGGRVVPLAWPSIEAAAAAGLRGGFIVVKEVLPLDEWARVAVAHMQSLLEPAHHGD